jgi:hypothetical protein
MGWRQRDLRHQRGEYVTEKGLGGKGEVLTGLVRKVPRVALVLTDDLEPNSVGGGLPLERCPQRWAADDIYALR